MKPELKSILGFASAGIIVIFLHAKLGFWIHDADTCTIFPRVSEIVYEGKLSLAGQAFYNDLRLGPLADYLTALPLFIFRRVEAIYLFVSVLWLISVILFFIVIKRYFDHRVAFWATFTYLFSISMMHLQIMPWNDSYLPIILPIYLYFTMRGRYEIKFRLLTYVLSGLMAQFHILTLMLIPTSWLFWMLSTRVRTPVLIHLAGFLIIFILHLPLVVYYLNEGPELIISSLSLNRGFKVEESPPEIIFKSSIFLILATLLIAPSLIIVVPLSIKKLKTRPPIEKRHALINIASFAVFASLSSLAVICTDGVYMFYYLLYGFPFLAVFTGILTKTVLESYKKFGKIAIGLSIFLSLLVPVIIYSFIYFLFSLPTRSLENQLWLAKKFSNWVDENNIFTTYHEEIVYLTSPPLLKESKSAIRYSENCLMSLFKALNFPEEITSRKGIPRMDSCLTSLIGVSGLILPEGGEPKRIKILELRKWKEKYFKPEDFGEDLSNCPERWEYKGAVFYICVYPAK